MQVNTLDFDTEMLIVCLHQMKKKRSFKPNAWLNFLEREFILQFCGQVFCVNMIIDTFIAEFPETFDTLSLF